MDHFDFEAEIDAKDALRKASLSADGHKPADSAASRGRHSIVCKHWLRNLCMKGDKCDFLHQYDPNRMPECVFWLKYGKCNDPECVFRHVAPSQRPECLRYRAGFCKYGPMCRSRHDRLRPDDILEVVPDKFLEDLLVNFHLVPKLEDVRLDPSLLKRSRSSNGPCSDLALIAPSTEEGTIPGLTPPIHGRCRYFIIRSMNVRNIQISAAKGIWATSVSNTQKLRQAFKDVDHAILILSASESRNFQGYAKITSQPDDSLLPGIWGDLSCRLGANFRVQWLKQCAASLNQTDHIKNNDDQPVKRCRDGQELPSSVGERLCRFLWQQPDFDLLKGSNLEFEPAPVAIKDSLDASRANDEHKANPNAPLALEDEPKAREAGDAENGRSRPAPQKLGSFDVGANWKEGLREAKDARIREARLGGAVSLGKALASGSSSLLAAMNEDRFGNGVPGPGPWAPPAGWRPPAHPHYPAAYYPQPGHFPPGHMPPPGYFPAAPHGPPMPRGPFGEAPPPGYWGDGSGGHNPAALAAFAQPPPDWQGAGAPPDSHRSEKKRDRRSRSPKKRKKARRS